ncbi:MAG: hypothetical protein JW875_03535 [Spirochaetales bacterium]|nr:hypothetical protein [Spirochaetales bacterium]
MEEIITAPKDSKRRMLIGELTVFLLVAIAITLNIPKNPVMNLIFLGLGIILEAGSIYTQMVRHFDIIRFYDDHIELTNQFKSVTIPYGSITKVVETRRNMRIKAGRLHKLHLKWQDPRWVDDSVRVATIIKKKIEAGKQR